MNRLVEFKKSWLWDDYSLLITFVFWGEGKSKIRPEWQTLWLRHYYSRTTCKNFDAAVAYISLQFFPGPQAFCKKAVERVYSEKNILNSSVKCVEWSGWSGFFRKVHMYVHHQIRLFQLINMVYFIFNLNACFLRNWRKCS